MVASSSPSPSRIESFSRTAKLTLLPTQLLEPVALRVTLVPSLIGFEEACHVAPVIEHGTGVGVGVGVLVGVEPTAFI